MAKRLKALRTDRGLSQEELARHLGVAREWVSKLENDREEFSEFVVMKMDALSMSDVKSRHTSSAPIGSDGDHVAGAVAESPAEYESPPLAQRAPPPESPRTQLNPKFAPPPREPTAQHCTDHFLAYLAAASHEPGGLGYTYRLLQKHFPLDEFGREKSSL